MTQIMWSRMVKSCTNDKQHHAWKEVVIHKLR